MAARFGLGSSKTMTITVNGAVLTLDWDTLLIWALIGLVAGFLASHFALGRGLGLLGDIVVGVIGAIVGGFLLSDVFKLNIVLVGHPVITEMVVAFIGALVLLLVVRIFSGGRGRGSNTART